MISPSDILHGKILIVDDQEANVQLLEQLLSEAGYTPGCLNDEFTGGLRAASRQPRAIAAFEKSPSQLLGNKLYPLVAASSCLM